MRQNKLLNRFSRVIGLLMTLVVVGLVVLLVHVRHTQPVAFVARPACQILTPAIAHAVGGNSLAQQNIKDAVTDTTTTSYCVYRGASSSVSVIVRAPKNAAGITQNKQAFSSPTPGSLSVRGYGDQAYWAPVFAQFNILDHNTWYIISSGPNDPAKRTLAAAKTLADEISADL